MTNFFLSKILNMPDSGDLGPENIGPIFANLLPEETIVCDEAATSGFFVTPHAWNAKPLDWLALTGGSIGQGLPLATGAAIGAQIDQLFVYMEMEEQCIQSNRFGLRLENH